MKNLTELLEGWNIIKAKLALTDDELQQIQCKQDKLTARLKIKPGKTKIDSQDPH
jgi:hypothetical protein